MSKPISEDEHVERILEESTQYKRDLKRESKGKYRDILIEELPFVVGELMNDRVLSPKYRDHSLAGQWKGFRDCHIKPDLVLIYRKIDDRLELERLGSHSELFK